MYLPDKTLVLASKSPRRQQLLREAGFPFEVRTYDTDESYPDTLPKTEVAAYVAKKKAAEALPHLAESELLITADTVVLLEGTIFEKPQNYDDAVRMLTALSGKKHTVITGVCLSTQTQQIVFSELASVYLAPLGSEEIDFYIKKYQPYDKAGAYAIQEWIGHCKIQKIEGTYTNIMGLPVHRVYEALQTFG